MTVIVTRDVPARFRGFLGSVMLEIAPGVYTGPRMNPAVRARVWSVLCDWHRFAPRSGVVMTWYAPELTGGQGVETLGIPPRWLVELDGLFLAHRHVGS